MKRLCWIIIGLCISLVCYGQRAIEDVLLEIERNNPELKAAAVALEQERLDNRSEALLENPEVEFNYLWGNAGVGNRHDVRISQAFDLATLSGMKADKAASLDELSALKYEAQRLELRQEARRVCIDLIYYQALLEELESHLSHSSSLVHSYERRMEAGGATILDLNKAKLHLASVEGQVNRAENERQALLGRLRALNGGKDPDTEISGYEGVEALPADFETWFAEASEKSPVLGYIRKEVVLGQQQLAIDRMVRMPEVTVGYMSEINTAEQFRGVTLGLNIPLWSGVNKVKRARAGVAAAESRQNAAEQEFYLQLKDLYRQAVATKENAEMMRASLADTDYRDFLLSALTKGEISMIDYLVENDLYYEVLEQALAAERDYRYALAALRVF